MQSVLVLFESFAVASPSNMTFVTNFLLLFGVSKNSLHLSRAIFGHLFYCKYSVCAHILPLPSRSSCFFIQAVSNSRSWSLLNHGETCFFFSAPYPDRPTTGFFLARGIPSCGLGFALFFFSPFVCVFLIP